MNNYSNYAQGVRCGHIDGKTRVGQYTIGEELLLSSEASENARPGISGENKAYWMMGYEEGYRLGASGKELSQEIKEAELP